MGDSAWLAPDSPFNFFQIACTGCQRCSMSGLFIGLFPYWLCWWTRACKSDGTNRFVCHRLCSPFATHNLHPRIKAFRIRFVPNAIGTASINPATI